uniref:Sushi domain-containing protein n=1 Tax=Amphilophus citrinellus TaxID=61819 RepID=A0A3Q0RTE1_AMPCI
MMCARFLGFVLLIWFPGVIRAQIAASVCQPPELNGGYFVPEQETYDNLAKLIYACDHGLKPAAEGWWATSECENANWSPNPQCIDEKACLTPAIPNTIKTKNQKVWYETQTNIQVTCEDGYRLKDASDATCINGNWSSLPVCESNSCSAPPKISNAVVINRGYQEVFAAGSEVQYHCEDGYTIMGEDTIFCVVGQWTPGPTCSKWTMRGKKTTKPPFNFIFILTFQKPKTGGTAGSGRQPSGQLCGNRPVIQNAEVVEERPMYLKYQCNSFYRRVGPETVTCYSDGSWSQLPTCEEAFCVMDPAKYARYGVKPGQPEYMQEGETKCHSSRVLLKYCVGI